MDLFMIEGSFDQSTSMIKEE